MIVKGFAATGKTYYLCAKNGKENSCREESLDQSEKGAGVLFQRYVRDGWK